MNSKLRSLLALCSFAFWVLITCTTKRAGLTPWLTAQPNNTRPIAAKFIQTRTPEFQATPTADNAAQAAKTIRSPDGKWFAMQSSTAFQGANQITISIYSLSSQQWVLQQPLLAPQMLTDLINHVHDWIPANEVYFSVLMGADSGHSWSPNSHYFAFASAHEGLSADLYIFDTHTLTLTRLTDGPTQIGDIQWSPDSQWIIHQGVENFGAGAGWNVDALWAAAADGSSAKKLAQNENQHGFNLIGWVSAHQLLTMIHTSAPSNRIQLLSLDDLSQSKTLFETTAFMNEAHFDTTTQTLRFTTFEPVSREEKFGTRYQEWAISFPAAIPHIIKTWVA